MAKAPSIVIRRAIHSDAGALRDVVAAAYAGYAAQGIDLPPVADGLDVDIRDRIVWVAAEGDRVLGGLVLAMHDTHGHLMNVGVDPAAGGRGVGRALMDAAEAHVRNAGLAEMRLATHRDLTGNVALYEHLGWQVAGADGARIFMVKRLSEPEGG